MHFGIPFIIRTYAKQYLWTSLVLVVELFSLLFDNTLKHS